MLSAFPTIEDGDFKVHCCWRIESKKDQLAIRKKGITKKSKTREGYELIVNTKILTISELLMNLSKKISIEDIEIEQDTIDHIIVKLYEDYKI